MTTEVTCALNEDAPSSQHSTSMIDALVARGFAREAAEDLCATQPPPADGDVEGWAASIVDRAGGARRAILEEHHKEGIPPLEPPPLAARD